MTKTNFPAIAATAVPPRRGSGYPHPFSVPCAGRVKHPLGDAFALKQYGVNLVTLPPGTWSSQRHWHSGEDEFVYILAGYPPPVTDAGRALAQMAAASRYAPEPRRRQTSHRYPR